MALINSSARDSGVRVSVPSMKNQTAGICARSLSKYFWIVCCGGERNVTTNSRLSVRY